MAFKDANGNVVIDENGIIQDGYDSDGSSFTDTEVKLPLFQYAKNWGWSIDAQHGRVITGSPESQSGTLSPGKIATYDYDGNLLHHEYGSNAVFRQYGLSVACGHGVFAAGEPRDDPQRAGSVRLWSYYENRSGVDAIADLTGIDDYADALFGSSVCISNNRLYVGEPGFRHYSVYQSGRIRVYKLDGTHEFDILNPNRLATNTSSMGFGSLNHRFAPDYPINSLDVGCGRIVANAEQNTTGTKDVYVYIMNLYGHLIKRITYTDGEDSAGYNLRIAAGKIFVTDLGNDRIDVYDLNGKLLFRIDGSSWAGTSGVDKIYAADASASRIYVTNPGGSAASNGEGKIYIFDHFGNELDSFTPSNFDTGEHVGFFIRVADNRLWVSGYDASLNTTGSVYMYKLNETLGTYFDNNVKSYGMRREINKGA